MTIIANEPTFFIAFLLWTHNEGHVCLFVLFVSDVNMFNMVLFTRSPKDIPYRLILLALKHDRLTP